MKPCKLVLLLVVFLGFASPANGEVKNFYGSLECRGEYYTQERKGGGSADFKDWGLLEKLELNMEYSSPRLDVCFRPEFRLNTVGNTQGIFPEFRSEDRQEPYATFREAYFVLKPWKWWEIGAGKKIHWWGVGEEINPTNFNPISYLNLVEPEEMGLFSAWTRIGKEFYLEVVGSKSTSSLFPWEEDNRWRPPALGGITIKEPEDVPHKAQVAGRVGWSGTLSDLNFTYFRGYKGQGFEFTKEWDMRTEYFRTQKIGSNLTLNLRWFGIKGEIAYNIQGGGQDDYIQWLVAADKYFSWERKSLYLIIQYVKENVTREGTNLLQDSDLSRSLKDAIVGKAEYEYGKWILALRGAYDFKDKGYYGQAKVGRRWNLMGLSLIASLGYDHTGGPKESFFGQYPNRRVFAETGIHF